MISLVVLLVLALLESLRKWLSKRLPVLMLLLMSVI
jgi:hypothetical protein